MADEPLSIRGVHWRDALPFTHLFRAFRVAIHPSKIVLGLAALLLSYVGGRALDLVWPVQDRAVTSEVDLYEAFSSHPAAGQSFADVRRASRAAVESTYAARLLADKIVTDAAAAAAAARAGDRLTDLKQHILSRRAQAVSGADADHLRALSAANTAADPLAARREADDGYRATVRSAFEDASDEYRADSRIKNDGLFEVFFDYESRQVSNAVQGVREWNWFGPDRGAPVPAEDLGPSPAGTALAGNPLASFPNPLNPLALSPAMSPFGPVSGTAAPTTAVAPPAARSPGIVPSVVRFFSVGPVWLLTQHPVYFALFGTGFLFLWAVFGGAICRIAAVHVARDEKLSIRSALVFSGGKFLSFLCAPLIPLGILASVGLLTTLASLVLTIVPWFGPNVGVVVLGAGFVLALLAGLVMAVVLVGLVGGFNLMYPTIAVEGSDSFDAISRSFSYLYARPWRLAFYTAVSVVYGAICYLFVRLFIYLVLALTHRFVSLGVLAHASSTAPLLSALWPDPATAGRLSYSVDALSLTLPQEIGAALIWFWVHLAVAVLGAFTICFYFSSNTIIYYLLRHDVDATDLNEVYVDPADEEDADEPDPADPVPVQAAVAAPAAAATPAPAAADPADAAPPT
jgi:hypothetical protein